MDQAPSTAAAGRLRAACEVAFVLCVESVDGAGTAAPVRKTSALVELSFEVSDQNWRANYRVPVGAGRRALQSLSPDGPVRAV